MPFSLEQQKIEVGATDYPVKHNEAMDLIQGQMVALAAETTGDFVFQGFHDASTTVYPTPVDGGIWVVDVAGTISGVPYIVGDQFTSDGTTFVKFVTNSVTDLSSPDPIGDVLPNTGAFTSLEVGGIKQSNRNLLINGDFQVAQRGVSLTATPSAAYTLDRWRVYSAGSNTPINRSAKNAAPIASKYVMQLLAAAGNTDLQLFQRVESNFAAALSGQNAVVSFWLNSPVVDTITVSISTPNVEDTWGAQSAVNSEIIAHTTGWQYISIDMGAMPVDTIRGLQLLFLFGASPSQGYEIGEIQLEAGNTATDFEQRSPQQVLADCERYFERLDGSLSSVPAYAIGMCTTTTIGWVALQYMEKRASPTFVFGNAVSSFALTEKGGARHAATVIGNVNPPTLRSVLLSVTLGSAVLAFGHACIFTSNTNPNTYIDIDSEL